MHNIKYIYLPTYLPTYLSIYLSIWVHMIHDQSSRLAALAKHRGTQ